MEFSKLFTNYIQESDSYKVPDKLMQILYNRIEREQMFSYFLQNYTEDLSYDWFHNYFQDEHAERKKNKQDFTPRQIADIAGQIVNKQDNNTYYEIAVGSGGMVISQWADNKLNNKPYNNENYFYILEELSDRTIPFLLFNIMIRGINAVVIHIDSLSRDHCKGIFFLQQQANGYSSLNLMPYTEDIEKEFSVQFSSYRYKDIKEDISSQSEYLIKLSTALDRYIHNKIIKTDKTEDYKNISIKDLTNNYNRIIVVDRGGIKGIYPEQIHKEILNLQGNEYKELQGIGEKILRVRI